MISAKVKLALRCRSMFSEKTSVLRARSGSPEKKSVSPRCNSGVDRVSFKTQQRRRNNGQQHRPAASSSSKPGIDARFRDTGADRRPPLARCQRERARRGHRELALESRNPPLAKVGEQQGRRLDSPPQHVEWQIPMAAAAGLLVDCRAGGCRGWREERRAKNENGRKLIRCFGRFFVDAAAVLIRRW